MFNWKVEVSSLEEYHLKNLTDQHPSFGLLRETDLWMDGEISTRLNPVGNSKVNLPIIIMFDLRNWVRSHVRCGSTRGPNLLNPEDSEEPTSTWF